MYCDKKQLSGLPFCGPHPRPHGARGLSKNYHLRFYPKLCHEICEIRCIPCAYVRCTSMIDQPWISGIRPKKQERYQNVTNFTYWPVLGSYNNWNIIEITPKPTPFEDFDEIHKVVLDQISENTASLVQLGMYGAINIDFTSFGSIMFCFDYFSTI